MFSKEFSALRLLSVFFTAGHVRRFEATVPRRSHPRVGELGRRTLRRRRGRTPERGRRPSRGGTPTSTTEITVSTNYQR